MRHGQDSGSDRQRTTVRDLAVTELPDLLTVGEVAAWLKTTRKAIYAKAERGAIPGVTHIGSRLYFFRSELLRWVEQGRVPNMEK